MRRVLAALCFVALTVVSATAQDGTNPFSLEYLTDSSDLIVQGTISEILPSASGDLHIKLQLAETLKGQAGQTIVVSVHPLDSYAEALVAAQKESRKILWFLVQESSGYWARDLYNRTYNLSFKQAGRRIVSMSPGGYFVGEERRLLAAIRKEADEHPYKNERSTSIAAPKWFGTPITYPLDDRVEKLARQWIRPRTGGADSRLLGVLLLRNFSVECECQAPCGSRSRFWEDRRIFWAKRLQSSGSEGACRMG